MTDQGKPSVCPTCGSNEMGTRNKVPVYDAGYSVVCGNFWHDSSPVPAATRHIEQIADGLAAELCLNTDDMPKVKNLLIDFAKEIQRAAIEPTGF